MSIKSVSPIDGRYKEKTKELSDYFSEYAYHKYRVKVEIEYLIFFSDKNIFDVKNSDFIISVIGEEFGLIGISLIIIAFGFLIYWMFNYSQIIRNQFGSLTIVGFASILFFHSLVNMGMAVGLFPVTGLPLPFISYGGTFLLSMFLILGVTQNIINNNFK